MKKSEQIKNQIASLEKELQKALEEEREKKYLWKAADKWSHDMIGFWDMHRVRLFLTALRDGHTLRMTHEVFGEWDVKMNSQKNRILVDYQIPKYSIGPSEDNILNYAAIYPTSCYILEYGN